MKKRLVSVMMAMTMTGMMLAGCGAAAPAAETAPAADTSADAAAEAPAAEASGQTFKVGIVQLLDHASLNQITENVEKQLDAIGQAKGVTFEYKDYFFNGEGDATLLNQAGAQLKDAGVDAVVAIATPTAQIMQSTFEGTDTPIIFSACSDPVGAGLVASFEAPGANITGTSDALNTDAIMNLILAQNPDAAKVGLLYSKSEDASTQAIADAKAFLDGKGIAYVEKTGTSTDEVNQAVDALIAEQVDAIFTPTDNTIMNAELAIYEKLQDARIPHYTGADSFALNGAFLGFGINYADLGSMTADIVADILVNKKDPASYGVVTLDNGIATINTDTAAALGYDLKATEEAFQPYCSAIQEIQTAQEFE